MKREKNIDTQKASTLAIVMNSLLILTAAFFAFAFFAPPFCVSGQPLTSVLVVAGMLTILYGGLCRIGEALSIRRFLAQLTVIDKAIAALQENSSALHNQRRDLLCHMQMLHRLIEAKEYNEAGDFIGRVYIQVASSEKMLRTEIPSVNALLEVKLEACAHAGIQTIVNIYSTWHEMPIPDWEVCRVLGDLLDHAIEALEGVPEPLLIVTLGEDLKNYCFRVEDNEMMIPIKRQSSFFQAGDIAKPDGCALSLYPARRTLQEWGGDISLSSNKDRTAFVGTLPRDARRQEKQKKKS